MAFFLVKVADEVVAGDFTAAWKTITGGVAPEVQTLETSAASAFQAFLAVFGPAEASTVLTSLADTVTNGIKAGATALTSGTVANAVAGASAAAPVLVSGATS